jgi:hypothetical protein
MILHPIAQIPTNLDGCQSPQCSQYGPVKTIVSRFVYFLKSKYFQLNGIYKVDERVNQDYVRMKKKKLCVVVINYC